MLGTGVLGRLPIPDVSAAARTASRVVPSALLPGIDLAPGLQTHATDTGSNRRQPSHEAGSPLRE